MRSASVVVVNHNYARFLGEAIESALAQTQPATEVVVVDDGSTDGSREVIASYGSRIRPVLQQNGGQAAAYNAGFELATGDVLCFLDADDALLPQALEQAAAPFDDPMVVKVHWPLREVDAGGTPTGRVAPPGELAAGDLRERALSEGPHSYETSPASGKAWSRSFLDRVLPIPERFRRKHGADVLMSTVAPLYGTIRRAREPQALYRVHGANNWASMDFDRIASFDLAAYELHCDVLAEHCRALGIEAEAERWKAGSWLRRRREAADEISALVPEDRAFVLIDGAEWGMSGTGGRRAIPFPERDGEYAGPPAGDEQAVAELDLRREEGASHVVVAWPAFWWLEHYAGMREYLERTATLVHDSDRLRAWDLRNGS